MFPPLRLPNPFQFVLEPISSKNTAKTGCALPEGL